MKRMRQQFPTTVAKNFTSIQKKKQLIVEIFFKIYPKKNLSKKIFRIQNYPKK